MLEERSALSPASLKFPRWMFRGAALYGIPVLALMYTVPPPTMRADTYYGFIGCALVFQFVFWIIGGNPAKYRALMLPCVFEKLVYAVPALALAGQGKAPVIVVPFAIMDLVLGTGFVLARIRTPA